MTAPTRTCTVEGCGNQPVARGWCSYHYHAWRATGNPLGNRRQPLSAAETVRLRRSVGLPDTGPNEACRKRWRRQEATP